MSNLITKEFLGEQLSFWQRLSPEKQKTVLAESNGLVTDVNQMGQGMLSAARRLKAIKAELVMEAGKDGRWMAYCKKVLPFSYRTAERWIERFERLEGQASPALLEAALSRGLDLLNRDYQDALKRLPPPKDPAPKAAAAYADELRKIVQNTPRTRQDGRRRVGAKEGEVRAFQGFWRAYNALPAGKARASWAVRLIGKIMAAAGLPAQRVEPEAIPDGYKPEPVGRPRKEPKS